MQNVPIESLGLFAGLPKMFSKHFSSVLKPRNKEVPKLLEPTWLSSSDIWQQITELKQQKNNTDYSFPYSFFKLLNVNTGMATDQFNHMAKNLYRMGMFGKANQSGVCNVHRFIPTDFHIEVTFLSDSYQEVLDYINKWHFVAMGQRLNSNWLYDGITLSVRVDMETGVNVSEEENAVESVNYYDVKTNLIVRGFSSENNKDYGQETVSVLRKLVIRQIDAATSFPSLSVGGKPSLAAAIKKQTDAGEQKIILNEFVIDLESENTILVEDVYEYNDK